MKIADLVSKIGFDVDAKPLDTVSSRLEDIKGRLAFLGAAELVRGVVALTQSMSGFAGDMLHAAETAGVTTTALQGLQYAAAQTGASAQDVSGALGTLSKGINDVRHGNEQAIETFKQVGFSAAQVASFRTSADAFRAVADRLSRIQDPIEKQAQANKLLGGSANALIPLLDHGSKGIAEFSEQAEKMGAVLGTENIKALHEVEESLGALWQTVKTFGATIASYFAPGVSEATKALLQWYAAHRQLLAVSLKKWAENALYAFGFLYGAVEGLIQLYLDWAAEHPELASKAVLLAEAILGIALAAIPVSAAVKTLGGMLDILNLAFAPIKGAAQLAFGGIIFLAEKAVAGLIAMLVQMAIMTETAFPALSAALLSFAGVLEATPIGWIITAVAALVLGLEAAYTMLFKGGSFKDTWLGQMWDGIKGAGSWVLDKLGMTDKSPEGRAPYRTGLHDAEAQTSQSGVPFALAANLPPPPGELTPRGAASSMAASSAAAGNQATTNINAPVTINVPAGTPPAAVADAVQEGIRQHLDRVSRETRRSLRPSQAY